MYAARSVAISPHGSPAVTQADCSRSRCSWRLRCLFAKVLARNKNKPSPVTVANVAPEGWEGSYAEMCAQEPAHAAAWEGV